MRYTRAVMRRSIAILLAMLFSWMLVLPVFAGSVTSNLPACCRKGGKHHCAMGTTGASSEAATNERTVSSIGVKCPCFPRSLATGHGSGDAPLNEAAIFAGLVQHPAGSPQSEAGYRISFDRARQKRGPPFSLFS